MKMGELFDIDRRAYRQISKRRQIDFVGAAYGKIEQENILSMRARLTPVWLSARKPISGIAA
jgi:hypothetical protein